MSNSNDQAEEIQKLFDDVDKIVPLIMISIDIERKYGSDVEVEEALLTLAKAVQTLRPSTSNSPTEYNPSPYSKTRLEQPKAQEGFLLEPEEIALILRTRKLQQREDTHSTGIDVQSLLMLSLDHLEKDTRIGET